MTISYHQFMVELYQEHTEEASFLYEQRLSFLVDPELEWFSSFSEQLRLEAHLDALIIGGEPALDVCKALAAEGDVGAVYTLVNLFCRLNQLQTLLSVLQPALLAENSELDLCEFDLCEFDLEDLEVRQAIQLALLDRMSSAWADAILQSPIAKQRDFFALFVPAFIKLNKLPQGMGFDQVLQSNLIDPVPFIQAAGHLRDKNSRNQLAEIIVRGEMPAKNAAVIAMFRMGFHQVVGYTMHNVEAQVQPLLSLAAGAPVSFFDGLLNTSQESWTENTIISLAIGGVADVIPVLIGLLGQESLAEFAAKSLFVITGARLTTTSFEEDQWAEDELFADELAAFKEGVMPQRTDGRPYGEDVEELAVDSQTWLHWWQHNHTQFMSGKRYRFGRLVSPLSLVQALHHAYGDHALRSVTYHELQIRYNANSHFSVMDQVPSQQASLRELYQWAEQVESSVIAGDWYFSGTAQ